MPEGVRPTRADRLDTTLGDGTLRDHDHRGVLVPEAAAHPVADPRQGERPLRDDDRVGAAGHPGVQRDPAGVPSHHLDDQRAVMRFGGRPQPVDGLRRHVHRGVEAEGVVGGREVVVDGLRHAHDRDAVVGQPAGGAQGVLAADGDQRVDALGVHGAPDGFGAALARGVRVRPRGAEDGPAAGQDVEDVPAGQRTGGALEGAAPAVAVPDDLVSPGLRGDHDRADHRVQPGTVAAAGQHPDTHVVPPSSSGVSDVI